MKIIRQAIFSLCVFAACLSARAQVTPVQSLLVSPGPSTFSGGISTDSLSASASISTPNLTLVGLPLVGAGYATVINTSSGQIVGYSPLIGGGTVTGFTLSESTLGVYGSVTNPTTTPLLTLSLDSNLVNLASTGSGTATIGASISLSGPTVGLFGTGPISVSGGILGIWSGDGFTSSSGNSSFSAQISARNLVVSTASATTIASGVVNVGNLTATSSTILGAGLTVTGSTTVGNTTLRGAVTLSGPQGGVVTQILGLDVNNQVASFSSASPAGPFWLLAGGSSPTGNTTDSGTLAITGTLSSTGSASFTGTTSLGGTISNSATLLNAGILTSSYSPASLPNLWSLTFSVETQQNWFGVVDDQMATSAEINGLALPLAVDTYGITSTSSDGNSFNFSANTSGFAVWGPKVWRLPTVAVFAQMDSVTTSSNSVISVGVNGESTNFWAYADYNPTTGSLSFQYNPGSGVVHTGTISVGANQTAPMLGVTGIGAIWNVWWQPDASSQPQVLITTSQSLDLTVPSTLAAIRPVMSGTFTGGTVAYKVHRLQAGYAKGNSVSNMNVVKWRDGQPVVKDGHLYYLVGTRQHPNIANNLFVSIYSQQCGIYEWDSNTNQTRCVADFSFNRGSNIYPESNGSMMVNDDGSCELLVPSWSTWTGGTGATGFTRIYKYHLPTFPRGAIALPAGTLLALPGDANGITDYDPDMLEPYGGLYTLAYSHRIESNGSYYPILATSPDMVTWTQLATYPSPTSGTQVEGNNLINWGGTIYEVPVDNVAANWPVYDLTMTLKGTIAIPIQGGNIHFCAFPTYRADGNMEMKCIAWNVAGYPGVNSLFPGSLIVTLRSTNTITGAAFPSLKNLQQ